MLLEWREATKMIVSQDLRRKRAELTECSIIRSLEAVAEFVRSRLKRLDNDPPRKRQDRSREEIDSGVCQLHGGRGSRLGGWGEFEVNCRYNYRHY